MHYSVEQNFATSVYTGSVCRQMNLCVSLIYGPFMTSSHGSTTGKCCCPEINCHVLFPLAFPKTNRFSKFFHLRLSSEFPVKIAILEHCEILMSENQRQWKACIAINDKPQGIVYNDVLMRWLSSVYNTFSHGSTWKMHSSSYCAFTKKFQTRPLHLPKLGFGQNKYRRLFPGHKCI